MNDAELEKLARGTAFVIRDRRAKHLPTYDKETISAALRRVRDEQREVDARIASAVDRGCEERHPGNDCETSAAGKNIAAAIRAGKKSPT